MSSTDYDYWQARHATCTYCANGWPRDGHWPVLSEDDEPFRLCITCFTYSQNEYHSCESCGDQS